MTKRERCTYQVLTALHDERTILSRGGDFGRLPNLEGLLRCLKAANPTAESVFFQGVGFPILRCSSLLIVLCPRVGTPLIVQHDPAAEVKFTGPIDWHELVVANWTTISNLLAKSRPQGNRNQRRRLERKGMK